MDWTKAKSLALSRLCVAVFMAALAAIDVGGYWLVGWFLSITRYQFTAAISAEALFLASLYLCSLPAWGILWLLHRLLGNIRAGQVFVAANVAALRGISWCCIGVAVVCLASAAYYLPFGLVAVAAAFMALIVRIVKNCFEQAIGMKDELDYTV